MAHNIKERDSQTGIEQAWHGLTKVVPKVTRENCGIVYAMEKRPLLLAGDWGRVNEYLSECQRNGKTPSADEIRYMAETETPFSAIVSLDDGLPIGGAVGDGYALVSNSQMLEMIEDALAGTQHDLVSVGTISNREKCFASIRLKDSEQKAGGRITQNVLNLMWGHGGIFGILARSGMTVIVCQNTFNAALGAKGKADFSLRLKHTKNSVAKLEKMAEAIDAHYGVVAEFNAAMDMFANTPCKSADAEKLFAGFLVREVTPDLEKNGVSTRTANQVETLHKLFANGKGNNGDDMSDAFNAFTDYYTHLSSGESDNPWRQVESSEVGMGHTRKTEAFRLLRGDDVPKLGRLPDVIKRGDKVLTLIDKD